MIWEVLVVKVGLGAELKKFPMILCGKNKKDHFMGNDHVLAGTILAHIFFLPKLFIFVTARVFFHVTRHASK